MRALRRKAGAPQWRVAHVAGVTQPLYSQVENDVKGRRLPLWRMQRVAEFYGLALADAFPEYSPTWDELEQLQAARQYLAEQPLP